MITTQIATLHQRHQALLQYTPRLRARDAAGQLGVSEAELVASMPGAIQLQPMFREILDELPKLGEVMVLTRNESAVHEKRGVYPTPSGEGNTVLVHSKDIDLRVFLHWWGAAFAVRDTNARGEARRSLQFFDPSGEAVHKIWLEEHSDVAAFDTLVERFAQEEIDFAPRPIDPPQDPPDDSIDVAGLRAEWERLEDTHQFFFMLRKYEVGRMQALRLVGGTLARRVSPALLPAIFASAATSGTPIMVFVGSRGVIQIHSGPIERYAPKGEWLNILDREFGLHLRQDHVAHAYVVRKPTVDGDVTSLEVFDAEGREIALLFGERKPGKAEAQSWRNCLRAAEEGLDV